VLLVSALLLLATALATVSSCVALVVALTALYPLFDTVVVNTAIVYSTGRGIHPLRSAVLMNAYLNVALCFGPWWLYLNWKAGSPVARVMTAVYQSLLTLATVGPDVGSDAPITAPGKLLVTVELLVGVYFLIVIPAIYVSWATGRRQSRIT
jgi:hypothetical protein